jgi:hypothetical protein
MFFLRSIFVIMSFAAAIVRALPLSDHKRRDTGSALANIVGAIGVANATGPVIENADPIEGQSYFYIVRGCTAVQKKTITQAYEDATTLADAATKWPDYGNDAMDLYMGKKAEDRPLYKSVIQR